MVKNNILNYFFKNIEKKEIKKRNDGHSVKRNELTMRIVNNIFS